MQRTIWYYIIKDMLAMIPHLLCGVMGGMFIALLLHTKKGKTQSGQNAGSWLAYSALGGYLIMLLTITFLSRESGSGGAIDLELFSSLKINTRNNAYAVENILLFVPYGMLLPWAAGWTRRLWKCTFLGALTSLFIESLQLLTGRGCFQVDDILTNWLGSVIGYGIFFMGQQFYQRRMATC